MGVESSEKLEHWEYFLILESDLLSISRYVEFNKENYHCHSMELARILMQSCAEIDVVLKQICKRIDEKSDIGGINDYCRVVAGDYNVCDFRVLMRRFGLAFTPWSGWQCGKPPVWWSACNKVKHERHVNFQEAHLQNALNAVSALFVCLLFMYKNEAENAKLYPSPILLDVDDDHSGGFTQDGCSGVLVKNYKNLSRTD